MSAATSSPSILVAPLNWGLGHASRCVPIIRALLAQGARPVLASDGRALELLQREFPHLPCRQLPSYRIRYREKGHWTQLFWLLPRIARAAWNEHRHIRKLVAEEQIAGIISDNRLGCFHPQIPSVYLTHQLSLPLPLPWVARAGSTVHRWFIRKYAKCWVPDFAPPDNLSGRMAEAPQLQPIYLGPLSRFRRDPGPDIHPVVAVLSGPEPQRTQLEVALLRQLQQLETSSILVAGTPEEPGTSKRGQVTRIGFLQGQELDQLLARSEIIICRAGYSSLMDLYHLQKKAILIPTPGQPEQEELARRCQEKGWMPNLPQHRIHRLEAVFDQLDKYSGFPWGAPAQEPLQNAVKAFLETVR